MARARARCTEADIKRIVNGVRQAGVEVACYKIDPDGTIHIIPGQPPADLLSPPPEPNPWDDDE